MRLPGANASGAEGTPTIQRVRKSLGRAANALGTGSVGCFCFCFASLPDRYRSLQIRLRILNKIAERNFGFFARRRNHPTLHLVHNEAVFRRVAGLIWRRAAAPRRGSPSAQAGWHSPSAHKKIAAACPHSPALLRRGWGRFSPAGRPPWHERVSSWSQQCLSRRSFNSSAFSFRSKLFVFLQFSQLALQVRNHRFQGRHLVGLGALDGQRFPLRLIFHLAV